MATLSPSIGVAGGGEGEKTGRPFYAGAAAVVSPDLEKTKKGFGSSTVPGDGAADGMSPEVEKTKKGGEFLPAARRGGLN